MNFICCLQRVIFTLFTVASLLACSGKTETAIPQAQKTIGHTKAGKPGASLKLVSVSTIVTEVNQLTPIEIALETTETSGELVVEFNPGDGLNLIDTPVSQIIKLTSSSLIKIPVSVISANNGRYYLNIHARLNNNDVVSARNLALIVQVGAPANDAKQLKKAAGENVISLPATESILSR